MLSEIAGSECLAEIIKCICGECRAKGTDKVAVANVGPLVHQQDVEAAKAAAAAAATAAAAAAAACGGTSQPAAA